MRPVGARLLPEMATAFVGNPAFCQNECRHHSAFGRMTAPCCASPAVIAPMCMALYLASDRPLPLIEQREIPKDALSSPTWPREAQRFHTALLRPEQEVVRSHFSLPHILYA